jgi:DNA-binding MarR family transcriptional regulator/GNAT superfamily N-acetyltransferase
MELADFTKALVAFHKKWHAYVGAALASARGELSPLEEAVLEALATTGDHGLSGSQVVDRAGVDKAHVARTLEALRQRQWITSAPDERDARAKVHRLARKGWTAHEALRKRRHGQLARRVADLLPEARANIANALTGVATAFEDRNPWKPLMVRQARAGDYGWVIERHGAIYASEFHYDETFEAFVAEGVARFVKQHDARRETALIAEHGGRRVACAFVVRDSAKVARLRFFLVDPEFRGGGIGGRLLDQAIVLARAHDYDRMVLWTQSILTSAISLYRSRGFALSREEPYEGFGRRLRAQEWALDLKAPAK